MHLTRILQCYSKLPKDYSNIPESFKKRFLDEHFIYWKTPKGINHQPRTLRRKTFNYSLHRPWTREFLQENAPHVPTKVVYVEPLKEWNFFRGDRVEVLVGKDKGKIGVINYIVRERNWVTVEGLNCKYETYGKTNDYPGMMFKVERPLLVPSEVALIDPSDNRATDIEWRYTDEGEKVRVSVRSGRVIPFSIMAYETMDYKERKYYAEQPKDTKTEELSKVTFDPKLKTFQQEIMEEMEITEDRSPGKTYWY